ALMDSAAAALPGDPWIAGQRVRMLVDQQDFAGAFRASVECRADLWWCLSLRGYALHASRLIARAAATFDSALAVMPDSTRCRWNDLSSLFGIVGWNAFSLGGPGGTRGAGSATTVDATQPTAFLSDGDRAYRAATCAGRDSINATIWWLAQPLYLEPGNERKTDITTPEE
ncbi:MAG TPA: hypothetical protein VMH39_02955, partial [Gemmatimonadaceae bacterium]|nr:hypothetical protein [Gemmatimonadaceae bacterium]